MSCPMWLLRGWIGWRLDGEGNGVDVTSTDGEEETQDGRGHAHGSCWPREEAGRRRRLWKRRCGMRPEKDKQTGQRGEGRWPSWGGTPGGGGVG